MQSVLARLVIVASMIAAASLAGCTSYSAVNAGSGGPATGQASTRGSADVDSRLLQPADLVGTWSQTVEDSRKVVTFDEDGTGSAYSHITTPGVPGITAAFPFEYSASGGKATLVFEDGHEESFIMQRASDGTTVVKSSDDAVWMRAGRWTHE